MMPLDPDRLLLEALRSRAPSDRGELFALLYERHRGRIHALCLRLTRNEEDALDALQESFSAVARQLDRFRGKARFSTWLHRIAANKCREIRRKQGRRRVLEPSTRLTREDLCSLAGAADSGPSPLELTSATERDMRVRAAVEALPPWLRGATELRYFDGRSYEEVAAVLDLPVGTVKSRLFRAHRTLAQELEPLALSA